MESMSAKDRMSAPEYVFRGYITMPKNDPDAALKSAEKTFRPVYAASLAYYRGDFEAAKRCYRETDPGHEAKLTAASLAIAAAMSTGDYALYDEISGFLDGRLKTAKDEISRVLLSFPGALAACSMAVPGKVPPWLTSGDFSAYPAELRPAMLHLYFMYLRSQNRNWEIVTAAKTAYSLTAAGDSFTHIDVYYCLLCAGAAYRRNDVDTAAEYIEKAADLALPHGFFVPFVEYLQDCGGLLERFLEQKYPQYHKAVLHLWPDTWKNWMSFHNKYARDHIATVLTPREYHVALLLARGATYGEVAQRLNLSAGRIRNIASQIYGKLYVRNKREMSAFIL